MYIARPAHFKSLNAQKSYIHLKRQNPYEKHTSFKMDFNLLKDLFNAFSEQFGILGLSVTSIVQKNP